MAETEFIFDTASTSEQRASIADDLAAAFKQHAGESSTSDASAAEPPREAPSKPDHESAGSGERSDSDHAQPEKPAPQTAAAKAPKLAKDVQPQRTEAADENAWSVRNKETFSRLPSDVQRHIQDLEKQTAGTAEFRREYDPVNKMFEPYREQMKNGGWTPAKLVKAWADVEHRLATGDGAAVVAALIRGYKIDPASIIREHNAQSDPQYAANRARMDAARRAQTEAETSVQGALDDFAKTHPDFRDLEESMTAFARAGHGAGKPHAERLNELYDAARWASPKHRAAAIAERNKAMAKATPQVQPRTRGGGKNASVREALETAMGER
jgi:hypothetical protein